MMNKTGAEMATLRGEAQRLGVLTADQVKSAQDYNDALGALGFGMESVKRFIAVGLAPELTEMTKDFTDLLAANKDWIINGIKATVGVLRDMVDALIRVAPFIAAVGAAFLLAKVYTLGFAGSLALVFSPAILIAAGIAAVLVVLDDLIVAFQGGKSIIRDFFMEFLGFDIKPVLEGIVKVFNDVVGTIFDGAKIIFDAIEPMVPLLAVIGSAFVVAAIGPAIFAGSMALIASPVTAIVVGIAGIVWAVGDLSKALSGGQSVIRDFFLEFFGFDIKPLLEEIVEGFKEVVETLKNFGVGIFESWTSIFSGIGDILSGNFSEGFDKIGEGFSTMVDTWGELFRNVFGGIFDWAKNAALDILPDWAVNIIGGAGDAASGAASAVGDLASDAGGFISGLFNGGESDMPMAQPSQAMQPGGGRGNTVGQYSAVEQIVNMEIRTSDPEKAGKAASDGLQRQLEDARTQTRGRGGS